MFQELLNQCRRNIATVRSIIETNDELRKILFIDNPESEEKLSNITILSKLKDNAPDITNWRIYNYCAVVTRLYAIYESFVERLITDWVLLLPKLFPKYSELPEKIKDKHQIGVAELLLELRKNNSRFNYISVEKVIEGLYDGITDRKERYQLLPDIFIRHDQNLRKEALEKIFANAGIQNTWSWIKKHRAVNKFVEEILANEKTAEEQLKELITYRNDAAHGSIRDEILGYSLLLELCDFVEALCSALTELVTYKVLERRKSEGQVKNIGKITRWFNKPQAGRVKVNDCTLSVGDTLFLVSETKSYCQLVILENIKIDETDKQQIEALGEREVGVKFNVDAKKELSLYINVE